MYILGISAFYHDSAACLIFDGDIVAAAQEERFTRKKHDESFPKNAIQYCLEEAEIAPQDIDYVVFYEKPFLKFERLLETYLSFAPRGFSNFSKALPIWVKEKLFQKSNLLRYLRDTLDENIRWRDRLVFSEHHLSHAASAYYPSPFSSAAVLTMDGVGEWTTTSLAIGEGRDLKIIKEIKFPHSIGLLYSAFTYHTGFKVNSGEYKVMGLAPYGTPKYADKIRNHLIHIAEDGSFQLNMEYFDFATGLTMTNQNFDTLFGSVSRGPETKLTQDHMDLAASIQAITEEIVVKLARGAAKETKKENLCIAGGVALNCVANGELIRHNFFKKIWAQPAAGDAGGALGAALATWHLHLDAPRNVNPKNDSMKGSFLGPSYSAAHIKDTLSDLGAHFEELTEAELIDTVAASLAEGQAIGWMQGRMEFGPRALGSRSIIADPRSPKMQKQLNLKVKYRESFRPFAPSVLRDDVNDWFEFDNDSPYMLFVAKVIDEKRKRMTDDQNQLFGIEKLNVVRSSIPAVTHVDYSARIQTVHSETNSRYHDLISRFKAITGCPLLVNTSFNVRGEPIVCTPEDAFKCFMGTDLDLLVVENFLLKKITQNESLIKKYEQTYELD